MLDRAISKLHQSVDIHEGVKISKKNGFRVLMYHSVRSLKSNDLNDVFTVSANNFSEQMSILSGYSVAELGAWPKTLTSEVAVTFDDGYKDNLTIAAPILVSFNIPFTVFVTPKYIKSGDKRYLNPLELKELSMLPRVTIGAHGLTHCRLSKCSNDELWLELSDSKKWIEDLIGKKVDTLAYPHGDCGEREFSLALSAGYRVAATTESGINQSGQNSLALKRTGILSYDTREDFIRKINGYSDWMGHPAVRGISKVKNAIKRLRLNI